MTSPARHASDDAPPTIPTDTIGNRTIAKTFELTPRLIQSYAAGIDDYNPRYFDDARPGGLIGHPGLAFTFQWNSRHTPDRPLDPKIARLGVNSAIDLRLSRPFQQGDVITSQGETVTVRQIKPGVLTVQRYRMSDSVGRIVAELDYAGIIRGARTAGPDQDQSTTPPLPQLAQQPSRPIWTAEIDVTPQAPHMYTAGADIYNPIHTERAVALAAGLPDIILHGSATIALAVREIVNRSFDGDPSAIGRIAAQLRAMVLPGHPITVRCLHDQPDADRGRTVFFDVLNHEGEPAVANGVLVTGDPSQGASP